MEGLMLCGSIGTSVMSYDDMLCVKHICLWKTHLLVSSLGVHGYLSRSHISVHRRVSLQHVGLHVQNIGPIIYQIVSRHSGDIKNDSICVIEKKGTHQDITSAAFPLTSAVKPVSLNVSMFPSIGLTVDPSLFPGSA